MSDLHLAGTAARLERLEAETARLHRDHARLKTIAAVLACALAGTVALGAATVNRSATPMAIVDGNGTARVRIDTAGVHIYDAKGKQRAKLGFTETGQPSLDLSDAAGTIRETLYLTSDARPVLAQRDRAGYTRGWYYLGTNGAASLDFTSSGQDDRVHIAGTETSPYLRIGTGSVDNRIYFGISSEGGAILRLRGSNGNERIYLGETTEDSTQLLFDYPDGKSNFILQGGSTPFLSTYDANGTTRNYLGFYANGSQGVYFNDSSGNTTWQSP